VAEKRLAQLSIQILVKKSIAVRTKAFVTRRFAVAIAQQFNGTIKESNRICRGGLDKTCSTRRRVIEINVCFRPSTALLGLGRTELRTNAGSVNFEHIR
jgi:hypothetical protein